jgi:hypothetical protein
MAASFHPPTKTWWHSAPLELCCFSPHHQGYLTVVLASLFLFPPNKNNALLTILLLLIIILIIHMAEELATAIVRAATLMQEQTNTTTTTLATRMTTTTTTHTSLYACVYPHSDNKAGPQFGLRGIANLEQVNFKFMETLLLAAATKGYYRISGTEEEEIRDFFDLVNHQIGRTNNPVLIVLKFCESTSSSSTGEES